VVTADGFGASSCLVLLGEAGLGKTTAVVELVARARERKVEPDHVAHVDLCSVTDAAAFDRLLTDADVRAWQHGRGTLDLFMDSYDEGARRLETLRYLLTAWVQNQNTSRLRLRIACRGSVWPASLQDALEEVWPQAVTVYELLPLRQTEVVTAAEAHCVDAARFLSEVERAHAAPLASRPITLNFLLGEFEGGSGLSSDRVTLYRRGCLRLAEEWSQARHDTGAAGTLTAAARLAIAERIAGLLAFCARGAVWRGPAGKMESGDLIFDEIRLDEDPATVNRETIEEVLDTALFSSRGAGRAGISHQDFGDFLAASYLKRTSSSAQMVSLLTRREGTRARVLPPLEPIAAWVASMDRDLFGAVSLDDPDCLLASNLAAMAEEQRARLVTALLTAVDEGRVLGRFSWRSLGCLSHSGLAEQLRPSLLPNVSLSARRLAAEIAGGCRARELAESLAQIACSPDENRRLRQDAAWAVGQMEDPVDRDLLRPLLRAEGVHLDLLGLALEALWPAQMGAEEVFDHLRRREGPLGAYGLLLQRFISEIEPVAFPRALTWAAERLQESDGDVDANHILERAWEHLHIPEVRDAFARAVLYRVRGHYPLRHGVYRRQPQTPADDAASRRFAAQALMPLLVDEGLSLDLLVFSSQVLNGQDIPWLLDHVRDATEPLKTKMAELVAWFYRLWGRHDPRIADLVVRASAHDPVLGQLIAPLIAPGSAEPVEIGQPETESEEGCPAGPSLSERIDQALALSESGDLRGWPSLELQLTLDLDQRHYEYPPADLTTTPGWSTSPAQTRARVVEAARRFVAEAEGAVDQDGPAVRALLLLRKEGPQVMTSIPASVWGRWARALLTFPILGDDQPGGVIALVEQLAQNAPLALCEAAPQILHRSGSQVEDSAIPRLALCWSPALADRLLESLKGGYNDAECAGAVMGLLLSRGHGPTRRYVEDLLRSSPAAEVADDSGIREHAALALLRGAPDAGWPVLFPLLTQDKAFGSKVLRSYAEHEEGARARTICAKVGEEAAARFYSWLRETCPRAADRHGSEARTCDVLMGMQGAVLSWLVERGTPESVSAVESLVGPYPDLRAELLDAAAAERAAGWAPLQPAQFLALVRPERHRSVASAGDLAHVVLESLAELEKDLRGEGARIRGLWDEVPTARPKDDPLVKRCSTVEKV
jgi:hypothetical protein